MRGINSVYILGRLGKELESKSTNTGKSFVDLSIATNRSIKRGDEWEEETDWHTVRFWGPQAQTCCKYLNKGHLVAIEGSLRTDSWTDEEGESQYRSYVLGQQLHLLPNQKQSNTGLVPLR